MKIEKRPENPSEQHNLTNQSGTSPGDSPRNASRLDNCIRTKQQNSVQPVQPKIGRPPRDEPFTRVREGIELQCIINRNRDQWGNYTGEVTDGLMYTTRTLDEIWSDNRPLHKVLRDLSIICVRVVF